MSTRDRLEDVAIAPPFRGGVFSSVHIGVHIAGESMNSLNFAGSGRTLH